MDIKQIENLLEKTQIIKNKYDDLAEYTGENFNVFNILRLDEKELMHSAFIANLLNAKGNHGQKDVFLKLFINEIKGLFSESESKETILAEFNTSQSFSIEEEHIGRVDYELGVGGRIDIVVKSGRHQILIENKIRAGDQSAQLFRYYNHYKENPIIYLTPFGYEPSTDSKGILENTKDFICISYQNHIVNWIEQCIKEMANKPIIRETLNQYLHLVKQITNQTTNDKMEKELTELILSNERNYNAYNTLLQNQNDVIKSLINDSANIFIEEVIKVVAINNKLKFEVTSDLYTGNQYSGITLKSDVLKDLYIDIEFQDTYLNSMLVACAILGDRKTEIHKDLGEKFSEEFHNSVQDKHERFISYLWKKSSDMNLLSNVNLKELKFNKEIIPQLIEALDSIIKRMMKVIEAEYK